MIPIDSRTCSPSIEKSGCVWHGTDGRGGGVCVVCLATERCRASDLDVGLAYRCVDEVVDVWGVNLDRYNEIALVASVKAEARDRALIEERGCTEDSAVDGSSMRRLEVTSPIRDVSRGGSGRGERERRCVTDRDRERSVSSRSGR